MHHLRNTLLILTLVATIVSGIYVFVMTESYPQKKQTASNIPQIPQTIAEAKEEERSVSSLDGTKFLTMKMNTLNDMTTYAFYVTAKNDPIFNEKISADKISLGLPDNAWSPNDRYVFIEKNGNGVRDALVFQASGEQFSGGEQYIDVYNLYQQRNFPYIFSGATGWADNYLLIIETVKPDGTRGPKFWFEVPTKGFIQLAR